MTSIASILSSLTRLQHLELGNYAYGLHVTLGGDALSALGDSQPLSLMFLSLAGNWFGANGMLAVVPGLQRLTALESLRLDSNISEDDDDDVEDRVDCLRALAGCLQRMSALTELDLGDNDLDIGIEPTLLLGCLQQTPNLRYLDLRSNELGAGGVQLLAGSIQRMLKLQTLNLSSNNIGDYGVAGLAGSLMGSPYLTDLDISGNALTWTALRSLNLALVALGSIKEKKMTALEIFDLNGNDLGGLCSADRHSQAALSTCPGFGH